jgi:hypothetical protein
LVRVVYSAPAALPGLEQLVVRSNEVDLHFREQTDPESDVLSTMWHCMPDGEGGVDWTRRELARLAAVIERYPDLSVTVHARYAMARAIYADAVAQKDVGLARQAATALQGLARDEPFFRGDNVRLFIGKALIGAGDAIGGTVVITEVMRRRSALWADPEFVEPLLTSGVGPENASREWLELEGRVGVNRMDKQRFVLGASDE